MCFINAKRVLSHGVTQSQEVGRREKEAKASEVPSVIIPHHVSPVRKIRDKLNLPSCVSIPGSQWLGQEVKG